MAEHEALPDDPMKLMLQNQAPGFGFWGLVLRALGLGF